MKQFPLPSCVIIHYCYCGCFVCGIRWKIRFWFVSILSSTFYFYNYVSLYL